MHYPLYVYFYMDRYLNICKRDQTNYVLDVKMQIDGLVQWSSKS